MGKKSFFRQKVGLQTIAALLTIASFPFLYYGQAGGNKLIMYIGMVFVIVGMLVSPLLRFL